MTQDVFTVGRVRLQISSGLFSYTCWGIYNFNLNSQQTVGIVTQDVFTVNFLPGKPDLEEHISSNGYAAHEFSVPGADMSKSDITTLE